jgi:hypothetical protein
VTGGEAVAAAITLVALGIALGGGLPLHLALRSERDRRETMPRVDAEALAGRDTDDEQVGRGR